MTSTWSTTVAAAARTAGLAVVLAAGVTASVLGIAAVADAAPDSPSPHVGHRAGMYGDPGAAAPFWRRQHGTDCAEMAVADVVGEVTGREPTEQQITATAQSTPSTVHPGPVWHPGGPTDNRDLPALLAHYGVRSTATVGTTSALEQELASGHKVVAGVNGATLWNERGNRGQEDHFVVVTGIDTKAGVVHLNDSGNNAGRDEQVSLATFENSWASSHNFVVITN